MARRLQNRLKQSSIYAVALANLGRKEPGCTHRPHFCGSMRVTLFLSSEPSKMPPRLSIMEIFLQDFRYAFRQLLKNPGFTAVAVVTLALGIGANTGLFAILNELLLRPKPVANPDELWAIEPADAAGQPIAIAVGRPYYEAIRQHARVFKGVVGYAGITAKLRTKEGAERIYAELVSGDYFSFLGVPLALGRGFLPEEDAKPGTHSVAVISHPFWQGQFGGAADVIGKTITLNDRL